MLLKGAHCTSGGSTFTADIGIRDGLIAAIGRYLASDRVCPVFDLRGKWLMPGFVDSFCRAAADDENAAERFLAHSGRAALGGVTLSVEVVTPKPWESVPVSIERVSRAWPRSYIDRAFCVRAMAGQLPDVAALQAGKKIGLAYMLAKLSPRIDGFGLDDAELFALLRVAKAAGVAVVVSAEHQAFGRLVASAPVPHIFKHAARELFHHFSPEGELVAAARAIAVAEASGSAVHIFGISTRQALTHVLLARRRGVSVTAHIAAHSLLLSNEVYRKRRGRWYRPLPPLRAPVEQLGLYRFARAGCAVAIASAAPPAEIRTPWTLPKHPKSEALPLQPWAPRVLLARLFSRGGDKAAVRATRWLSERPQALAGFAGERGLIQVGAVADLVAFEPTAKEKLGPRTPKTSEDWNPLVGQRAFPPPALVLSRGRIVVERGELKTDTIGGEVAVPLALRA